MNGLQAYQDCNSIEFTILHHSDEEAEKVMNEIGAALYNMVNHHPKETRFRIYTSTGGWDCTYDGEYNSWNVRKATELYVVYDGTARIQEGNHTY